MSKGKPDDPYVTISQKGSKKFLYKMSRGKDFFENGWIDNFRVTLFDKDTLNFLRSLN